MCDVVQLQPHNAAAAAVAMSESSASAGAAS